MQRIPRRRYRDPLDEVWLATATRIGFAVARSADVYASTEGDRTIRVGTPDLLDADDCLAQMILHEMCHALVEGDASWTKPDWGLDNQSERDEPREQACLRLQAALTAPHGLREVLAPTTDHRAFYDGLGPDPLEAPVGDVAATLAHLALARSARAPFAPHLQAALTATASIVRSAAPFAQVPDAGELPPLVEAIAPAVERHPGGLPLHAAADRVCGGCAWYHKPSRGKGRCRQVTATIDPAWRACERWEADTMDCQDCGACCRAAYDSVEIPPRSAVIKRHPALVVVHPTYLELRREGDHCAALGLTGARYGCTIYEDRPKPCRDFQLRGAHCLTARRRVGLSR